MTPLERMIYDSALNDDQKKIELCNHIMVSDEHINILGNKPLTLDEIHEKMMNYMKNYEIREKIMYCMKSYDFHDFFMCFIK